MRGLKVVPDRFPAHGQRQTGWSDFPDDEGTKGTIGMTTDPSPVALAVERLPR
jgi:hypothetical protein